MNKVDFAKLLLSQREKGIIFSTFMPKALWIKVFMVWIILSIMAVVITYLNQAVGMFLIGWILSQVYLFFGMMKKSNKHWELFTRDMIDWEKVERIANE